MAVKRALRRAVASWAHISLSSLFPGDGPLRVTRVAVSSAARHLCGRTGPGRRPGVVHRLPLLSQFDERGVEQQAGRRRRKAQTRDQATVWAHIPHAVRRPVARRRRAAILLSDPATLGFAVILPPLHGPIRCTRGSAEGI